jgi:hypothetical protein
VGDIVFSPPAARWICERAESKPAGENRMKTTFLTIALAVASFAAQPPATPAPKSAAPAAKTAAKKHQKHTKKTTAAPAATAAPVAKK